MIQIDNNILIGIILVLIFYIYQNKSIEKMTNTESIDKKIKEGIKEVYLADLNAIRNLSEVSKQLQKDGIEIPGNLTVRGSFNYLPKGTIVAFNGKVAPVGWALCDGKNGTPDLRGRFIYGYGNNQGSVFGKTGGTETHQLNINEMPSHNHSMQNAGNHNHRTIDGNVWDNKKLGGSNGAFSGGGKAAIGTATHSSHVYMTSSNGNHTHGIKNNGGNKPHNNMPPYRVLSYIMKL